MPVEFIDPPSLAKPHGYHYAAAVTGGRTIYTAGQLSVDGDDVVVGEGDYRAQGYQAMANLFTVLEAAGAAPTDVVKMTVFMVDPSEENLGQLYRGFGKLGKEKGVTPTPASLVGVAALAVPGTLVEIEAIAVVTE